MSGRNIRPWEFILVCNKKTLAQMSAARAAGGAHLKEAAAAIVVLADESKTDVWTEDASIAMAYMHLMATEQGVGSCWIQGRCRVTADGETTEEYLRKLLDFPENLKLEAILALGMPEKTPEAHGLQELLVEKVHLEKF